MIDLERVKGVLKEADTLMASLDGKELDDQRAIADQSKGRARQDRARMSQDLQLLATRFELAAALVRIEYWYARGESDPTQPQRS